MVVSGFYDCVAALLKYRSYQKNLSDIALQKGSADFLSFFPSAPMHYPVFQFEIPKISSETWETSFFKPASFGEGLYRFGPLRMYRAMSLRFFLVRTVLLQGVDTIVKTRNNHE